jgi:hypothetical protein
MKEVQGVALQNEAAKGFWKVFWNKAAADLGASVVRLLLDSLLTRSSTLIQQHLVVICQVLKVTISLLS